MDANELKIGNIVSPKQSITFPKATQDYIHYSVGTFARLAILAISQDTEMVEASFCNKIFNQEMSIDSITPVSITAEVLLKCGFEEIGLYENVYYLDNFRIYLDSSNNIGLLKYEKGSNHFEIEVNCVHQLQNIYFSLTG